ncbi:MAG: hypothetical protein MRJ68_13140 [Nitrospira sp.]|nr:hypothetical protein [Nitrospira sp.]
MQRLYVRPARENCDRRSGRDAGGPCLAAQASGVVLQENFLFNLSVRHNIALTDPGMAMERVIESAQLAGAHEFIMELADGYDTLIGEHG